MDAHRLDLPDASYDLVTGGFVIHLVAEPLRVLAGLRRVLRPGARVALTTPGPCEDHGRWNAWNTLVGQFASRAAERLPGRDYGVAPYLRAACFAGTSATVNLAVHLPVASPQTCWDFHMSHGFAAVVEALDPADAAEFQRHALAELTRMHESGGIVLDRGAVADLATVPANDHVAPGSHGSPAAPERPTAADPGGRRTPARTCAPSPAGMRALRRSPPPYAR